MLQMAAGVALPTNSSSDIRGFWLGCVGIRKDGTIVSSRNGAVEFCDTVENHQLLPNSHAEGRLLRKLGSHGEIYVARVSKQDQSLKMAKPCGMCRVRITAAKVSKVYYSIDEKSYGLWVPTTDEYRLFKD